MCVCVFECVWVYNQGALCTLDLSCMYIPALLTQCLDDVITLKLQLPVKHTHTYTCCLAFICVTTPPVLADSETMNKELHHRTSVCVVLYVV